MNKILSVFIFFSAIVVSMDIFPHDHSDIQSGYAALDEPVPEPTQYDWLAHNNEPGQTYEEFLRVYDKNEYKDKKRIYIQPIGKFTKEQRIIIMKTAQFIKLYYGFDVIPAADIRSADVPADARLKSRYDGTLQYIPSRLIEDLLLPSKPSDAAAVIGVTAVDLCPGQGWNFVFGLATPDDNLGVWSLYRFGRTDNKKDFNQALLRMIKTAVHETGHMFSITHCINARCIMNGTNHIKELDSVPLYLCSECFQKIQTVNCQDPVQRCRSIIKWLDENGFDEITPEYSKRLSLLEKQ